MYKILTVTGKSNFKVICRKQVREVLAACHDNHHPHIICKGDPHRPVCLDFASSRFPLLHHCTYRQLKGLGWGTLPPSQSYFDPALDDLILLLQIPIPVYVSVLNSVPAGVYLIDRIFPAGAQVDLLTCEICFVFFCDCIVATILQ